MMLAEGRDAKAGQVFCDTEGNLLRKSNVVRRSFLPLLARAGLPRIRFHDLRHTAATLMLLMGTQPKVVAERLGHAKPDLVNTTYGHVLPTMQEEAAEKLHRLLG
jgi:integrase